MWTAVRASWRTGGAGWHRCLRQRHRHARRERCSVRRRHPGEQPVGDEQELFPMERWDSGRDRGLRRLRRQSRACRVGGDHLRRVRPDLRRGQRRQGDARKARRRSRADGAAPDPLDGPQFAGPGGRGVRSRRHLHARSRQRLQRRVRRGAQRRRNGDGVLRRSLRGPGHRGAGGAREDRRRHLQRGRHDRPRSP